MDNFRFDMTCEGSALLVAAFELVFKGARNSGASHYSIREPQEKTEFRSARPRRMVFYGYGSTPPWERRDYHVALPFKMNAGQAAQFALGWLAEVDYGREPDHDGDNGKGWRLYNEGWGQVDDDHGAIIAVAPAWAMYGK